MSLKVSSGIVSKVDVLAKDFADSNVHFVEGQDQRKSPTRMRPNLWCTYCGGVGHAIIECRSVGQYHLVKAVEWAPTWESGGYYVENAKDTAYAVQGGPFTTPIHPVHIPRYA